MKRLVWLAVLAAVFYGHGRMMLAPAKVQRWIELHEQAVFAQKDGVCDDFSYDTEVRIRAGHATGEWQVDGGRSYVCDYIKTSNAVVWLLKPEIDTRTELVSLKPSGFPWMTAEAHVRQTTRFRVPGRREFTESGETTYVVRRTIRSLQITKMTSSSEGNFPR